MLAALGVAVIGFAIQQTAIVPAIQTVQRSLGASPEWSAWLVTVYLIVATVATPAMGRLADLHGRRRLLLIGLAVFVAGSVAAAFAPNMPVLICCRAVQGVGGSVYPLSLAIAREQVPAERVTHAVALLTAAFGIGTAVGFVGGGLLAEYSTWRWIFGAGAVVVAAAAALSYVVLPESGERAHGGFDGPGTALLTAVVISLLTGLTLVVSLGWLSPVLALFALAVVCIAAWTRLERRRADPLIDVHVLTDRRVLVANLATVALGWGLFSSYLLVPTFAQTPPAHGFGLGMGAAGVGLVLLPLAVGQTAAATAAGRLEPRIGARAVFGAGLVVVAAGLVALCFVSGSVAGTAAATLAIGIGAGLGIQASSQVATSGVAEDVAAVSSAVNSTVRRLAGGIGGQVSTMLLASLTLGAAAQPSRAAFVVGFLVAVALLCAGVVLLAATGRGTDAA